MTEMARHWIDSRWLESELVTDSYNPATGSCLAGSPTVEKPRPARRSTPPVVPSRTPCGGATGRCVQGRCWNSPRASKRGPRNWL
jgi:hypothetical protein